MPNVTLNGYYVHKRFCHLAHISASLWQKVTRLKRSPSPRQRADLSISPTPSTYSLSTRQAFHFWQQPPIYHRNVTQPRKSGQRRRPRIPAAIERNCSFKFRIFNGLWCINDNYLMWYFCLKSPRSKPLSCEGKTSARWSRTGFWPGFHRLRHILAISSEAASHGRAWKAPPANQEEKSEATLLLLAKSLLSHDDGRE